MAWSQILTLSAALATLVAAPLLLSRAWRRGDGGRMARAGGWLALATSMVLFATLVGPLAGIALALTGLPFPALAVVWSRRERQPMKLPQGRRPAADAGMRQALPRQRWVRAAARATIALPLALLAATSVAIWLSYLADHTTSGIVTALALVVSLWAAAAWWSFADPKLWRPAAGLLLAVASGLPLWLR